MTYETNLRTAQRLMTYLEMYSRINRFMAEHNAFMAEPDVFKLRTLSKKVGAGTASVKEDTHVIWVYEYYMYLENDKGYNGESRILELRTALNDLNTFRFPRPPTQAYLAGVHRERMERLTSPRNVVVHYARALAGREWHHREQNRGYIHNAVFRAWDCAQPDSTEQLVMEWPRVSKQGDHMIAYTRDEKYGEADRQLTTSVGKYLARHFPALSSNVIRDIAALYVEADIEITHDHAMMMEIIENGPGSCMSGESDGFSGCGDHHPYEAYDPKYGWHMAYIKEGNSFTGRALLNDDKWVRTYRGSNRQSYSDTDERLNAWLREQGYSKAHDWKGYKLARIDVRNDCGFVAPYLDGGSKDVELHRDHLLVVGSGDGEYDCCNTDGNADERNSCSCGCCGNRTSEDELFSVGRHGDESVCLNCYENDYTTVYGRRGEQYAIPNSDAIEADGEYYDPAWLSDNDIVELHDGDYTYRGSVTWIESVSAYYPSDSDDICYTKAGDNEMRDDCVELADGEWCLTDEAWMCEHSGDWYADDVDYVTTKGGKRIHPDHADEYILENAEQQELPLELSETPVPLTTI